MSCCFQRTDGAPSSGGSTNTVTRQGIIVPVLTAASPVGSTDSTVILWTGASVQVGTVALASWVTRADSATLGTTFTIIQPGIYSVVLYIPFNGGDVANSVTLDATAAQRQTAIPEPMDPQCYANNFQFATGDLVSKPITALVPVLQADIDAGGGANVIRAHVVDINTPGAPPPAAIFLNTAETVVRIFRVGDVSD